jgi:hypothetical protein
MYALKLIGGMLALMCVLLGLAWVTGESGKRSTVNPVPVIAVDEPRPVRKQVKLSDRYKNKFMDLYDEVKLTEAGIETLKVKDVDEVARSLKGKISLLPQASDAELANIDGLLKSAAEELITYVNSAKGRVEAEQQLAEYDRKFPPGSFGGPSSDLIEGYKSARDKFAAMQARSLQQCRDSIALTEGHPLFDQLSK